MPRSARPTAGLRVWHVQSLRHLELRQIDAAALASAPHLHGEFEIGVMEHGTQRIRSRGATWTAGMGMVVVLHPDTVHEHIGDGAVGFRSFFPDLAALVDASDYNHGTPTFRAPVIADGDLAAQLSALHRLLATSSSNLARETTSAAVATTLVSRHAKAAPKGLRVGAPPAALEFVRDYLNDHLATNVRLVELVTMTGLSAHTLVRGFAATFGLPPHAYHVQVRVNRARALLARGESLARVAAATGFTDQSHLTRHFRRVVGVTPGAYAAAVVR
jgi:AraC-like DNA-binding protein